MISHQRAGRRTDRLTNGLADWSKEETIFGEYILLAAPEALPAAPEVLPAAPEEGTEISPWNSKSDGNMCPRLRDSWERLRDSCEGLRGLLRSFSSRKNVSLYEGLSVRWSVGPSVRWTVRPLARW